MVLRTDIAPITRTTTHAARSAAKFVPAPLPISKTAALAPKFTPSTIFSVTPALLTANLGALSCDD